MTTLGNDTKMWDTDPAIGGTLGDAQSRGLSQVGSQPLTVIQGDDVKAVEKLALIFMNPFHLDIKEGVGVDVNFVFPLEVCRELQLVFLQIEETEG